MAIGALGQSFDHEDPDIRTVGGGNGPGPLKACSGATLHRLCESLVPPLKKSKRMYSPILEYRAGRRGDTECLLNSIVSVAFRPDCA